jgi:hypothetical protein
MRVSDWARKINRHGGAIFIMIGAKKRELTFAR